MSSTSTESDSKFNESLKSKLDAYEDSVEKSKELANESHKKDLTNNNNNKREETQKKRKSKILSKANIESVTEGEKLNNTSTKSSSGEDSKQKLVQEHVNKSPRKTSDALSILFEKNQALLRSSKGLTIEKKKEEENKSEETDLISNKRLSVINMVNKFENIPKENVVQQPKVSPRVQNSHNNQDKEEKNEDKRKSKQFSTSSSPVRQKSASPIRKRSSSPLPERSSSPQPVSPSKKVQKDEKQTKRKSSSETIIVTETTELQQKKIRTSKSSKDIRVTSSSTESSSSSTQDLYEQIKQLKKKYYEYKKSAKEEESRLKSIIESKQKEIDSLKIRIEQLLNENESLKKRKKSHHSSESAPNTSITPSRSSKDIPNYNESTPISPSSSYSSKKESQKFSKSDYDSFLKSLLPDLQSLSNHRNISIPISQNDPNERRHRIINEILETERNYVSGLSILMNNWYNPLIKISEYDSKIPYSSIQKIFADGSLELISILNNKLCESLEERISKEWDKNDCVGDIFEEWGPRLAPYRRYSSKYEDSVKEIIDLEENNSRFKKVLSFLDEHSMNFNGLKLTDYLITPVQRIPRYNLLLRDLLSSTDPKHKDYEKIKSAIEKISQTATTINETIRQAESQKRMADIIARGNGFEMIVKGNPYRMYIKHGNVDFIMDVHDRKKGVKKHHELLLFNDMIVAGSFVSKKSHFHEFAMYLNILWVRYEPDEIPDGLITQYFTPLDLKKENAIMLKSPESLWLIGIKDLNEREQWIESLIKTMNINNNENIQRGLRKGKYDFTINLNSTYEGEWMNGEFHGYGVYKRSDGTIFDGYWDNRFKAGFGYVTKPNGSDKQLSGWINNIHKGSDVEIFTEHQLWGSNHELTDRDWSVILTGAREIVYKKGQTIIEQDVENSNLYRVKSGKCRVEKKTNNGERVVLSTLGTHSVFGDTSVLNSMKVATAYVISDTETVLQSIEVKILFEVLKTDPTLSMKFFKHIAIKLAMRLKNLDLPSSSKKVSKKKRKSIHPDNINNNNDQIKNTDNSHTLLDVEFRSKFDLPNTEIPLKVFQCSLKGVFKKYGLLYISQHYVCFDSNVFGFTSREVIQLSNVNDIKKKKDTIKILSRGKKMVFSSDNIDEIYSLLMSLCQNSIQNNNKDFDSTNKDNDNNNDNDNNINNGNDNNNNNTGGGLNQKSLRSMRSRKSLKRLGHQSINLSLMSGGDQHDLGQGLSKADWNLIQQGFKCITYVKDEPIIKEGDSYQRIYQIAKGSCRIEISRNDGSKNIIGHVKSGDLLGEIGFLQGTPATASVIADDDAVDVYVIEGYFINILFVKNPDMAGRFYCYLATVIAGRLNERESKLEKKKRKKIEKSTSEESSS